VFKSEVSTMAGKVNSTFSLGIVAFGGGGRISDAAGKDDPFPTGSDPFGEDTFFAQLGLDQSFRAKELADAATTRQDADERSISESVRKREMKIVQTDEAVSSFQLLVGELEYDFSARVGVVEHASGS
jgi:hypothetical protein